MRMEAAVLSRVLLLAPPSKTSSRLRHRVKPQLAFQLVQAIAQAALYYHSSASSRKIALCNGSEFMASFMVSAGKGRRSYLHDESDTYVILEPGQAEEFVTVEELRAKLKGWLENWPGNVLPPDLAIFSTTDEAVSHLLKSACELEIDGDVGSIQWYQVRLD